MRSARALVLAVAAMIAWDASPAFAQPKAECLSAFDRAQDERSELQLRAARDDFKFCARTGCSPPVRKDCTEKLEEVLRDLPSIVVGARLSTGSDLSDAAIFVDGERTTPDAGGLVAVDPGPHTIRFERPPYAAQQQSIIAHIGEKSRLVLATFTGPDSAPAHDSQPAVRREQRPLSPWVWIAGGASIVALGSFTVFALTGNDKHAHLEDTCAPACSDDEVGAVRTRFIAADISLGVAAVSLATAALLFFLDRPSPRAQRLARSFWK